MGKVVFLGVEGSGKSVLTASFINAFKAHQTEGWFLKPASRDTFRYIEQLPERLEIGNLPPQNTTCHGLEWSVMLNHQVVRDVSVLDYPGEVYRYAFLDEEDEPEESRTEFREKRAGWQKEIHALLAHLVDAEMVFVLFNLSDAKDIARERKNLDAVWVTDACLYYLKKLPSTPRIVLLLTQMDRFCDLRNAEIDVNSVLRQYIPLVAHNHGDVETMAISALIDTGERYGLDGVIAKWFVDAPAIKKICDAVLNLAIKCSDEVSTYCECPGIGTHAIREAIKSYGLALSNLPWFSAAFPAMKSRVLVDRVALIAVEDVCNKMSEWSSSQIDEDVLRRILIKLQNLHAECHCAQQMLDATREWAKRKLEHYERQRLFWRKLGRFCGGLISCLVVVVALAISIVVYNSKDVTNVRTTSVSQGSGGDKVAAKANIDLSQNQVRTQMSPKLPHKENDSREMKELERDIADLDDAETKRIQIFVSRKCRLRATVDGKDVVSARFRAGDGKVYMLPRTWERLPRDKVLKGGKVTATVNGFVYAVDIADLKVNWDGEKRIRAELKYCRRATSSDVAGVWIAGLRHPLRPHWISAVSDGKWRPEKGWKEKYPSLPGLGELVKI